MGSKSTIKTSIGLLALAIVGVVVFFAIKNYAPQASTLMPTMTKPPTPKTTTTMSPMPTNTPVPNPSGIPDQCLGHLSRWINQKRDILSREATLVINQAAVTSGQIMVDNLKKQSPVNTTALASAERDLQFSKDRVEENKKELEAAYKELATLRKAYDDCVAGAK